MEDLDLAPDFPGDYQFCTLKFTGEEIFIDDHEPSKYIRDIAGTVIWEHPELHGSPDSKPIQIGAFFCRIVDVESAMNDRYSIYDVFDTEQSTFDIFQYLHDPDTEELTGKVAEIAYGKDGYPFSYNVLLLDRLVIYPEHRGHGVGLVVLRALIEHLRASVGLLVMKPFPLQFETLEDESPIETLPGPSRRNWKLEQFSGDDKAATKTLVRYYKRLGFKAVPGTQFMVRDAKPPLPSFEELTEKKPRSKSRPNRKVESGRVSP